MVPFTILQKLKSMTAFGTPILIASGYKFSVLEIRMY